MIHFILMVTYIQFSVSNSSRRQTSSSQDTSFSDCLDLPQILTGLKTLVILNYSVPVIQDDFTKG